MIKRSQYIKKPISTVELERRWSLVRGLMEHEGLDCVLAQNSNMHLGGYVRWFTDIPAEYNHNMTVLFYREAEMAAVRSTASGLPGDCYRGVSELLEAPFCPSIATGCAKEAELVAASLKKHGVKRLGFAGKAQLSSGMMLRLKAALPGVELIDVSNAIDRFKAIKSDEEMAFLRETVRLQDLAFTVMPAIIRPGMTESEIRSDIIRLMMDLGSEEQLVFIGTAPPGQCSGLHTACYVNRRVQQGDYGNILVEVNGPGGFYAESARTFVLGEPFPQLETDWANAVKAQRLMQEMLRPGTRAGDIVDKYNEFARAHGYNEEDRLFGHSQGYDLVERPAMMRHYDEGNEDMTIEAGMFVSLHPYFIDESRTVYINDNFYVGPTGAEKLHQTPPELVLV